MRLIIDVDEVLRETIPKVVEIYNNVYKKRNERQVKYEDIKQFELHHVMHSVDPNSLFRVHSQEIFLYTPPTKNAKKTLEYLIQDHDIVIATSQMKGIEKYTCEWLNKHKVPYNSLVFTQDKHLLEGDVMLDDAIHNLDKFYGTRICMDRPWNRHKKYIRVNDMDNFKFVIDCLTTKNTKI